MRNRPRLLSVHPSIRHGPSHHAHPHPRRLGRNNIDINHASRLHDMPRRPVTRPQDAVDRGAEMYMGTRLGGKVLDRDCESTSTTHGPRLNQQLVGSAKSFGLRAAGSSCKFAASTRGALSPASGLAVTARTIDDLARDSTVRRTQDWPPPPSTHHINYGRRLPLKQRHTILHPHHIAPLRTASP